MFCWVVGLNMGYVIVEGVVGWIIGLLVLLVDVEYNLIDVDGLLIVWGVVVLVKWVVMVWYIWGLGWVMIFVVLFNVIVILVGVGVVMWEVV